MPLSVCCLREAHITWQPALVQLVDIISQIFEALRSDRDIEVMLQAWDYIKADVQLCFLQCIIFFGFLGNKYDLIVFGWLDLIADMQGYLEFVSGSYLKEISIVTCFNNSHALECSYLPTIGYMGDII